MAKGKTVPELTSQEREERERILSQARGTEKQPKFLNIFQKAIQENLGQPKGTNVVLNAYSTVADLAARFVDEHLRQTGTLPTESEVNDFLGVTISQGFAAQTLSGEISPESIQAQIITPAVKIIAQRKEIPTTEDLGLSDIRSASGERKKALSEMARLGEEEALKSIETSFGGEKRKLIEEEAALGRLRQPQSIVSLAGLEEQKARSLSDVIRAIQAKKLGLQSDVAGEEARALQQAAQFGQTMREGRRQFGLSQALEQQKMAEDVRRYNLLISEQARESREERELAKYLGREQAEAMKPGALDYLNTAFQALAAVTGLSGGYGGLDKLRGSGKRFMNLFKKTPKSAGTSSQPTPGR